MSDPKTALPATEVPERKKKSAYPEPFASRVDGRTKRKLGDHFGLTNFGVNLTCLAPGSQTALLHRHAKQDEFVYVIEGHPTLRTDDGAQELSPGMCVGFAAGGTAHHLVNNSDADVVVLEVGDRTPGDSATYPEDDLVAEQNEDGSWAFSRKDGTRYV